MRFGGETQFGGNTQFGGDPFGITTGYIIGRILTQLNRFKRVGTAGSVQTVARLTAPLGDTVARDLISKAGTPAMLVAANGSVFTSGAANASRLTERVSTLVICVASSYRSRKHRLEGRNVYDIGLDNMTKWALVYAGRALVEINGLSDPRAESTRLGGFSADKFISITEWTYDLTIDLYDDVDTSTKLEKLGVVHDPTTYAQLFEVDNLTPKTDSPTSPAVGVADLTG